MSLTQMGRASFELVPLLDALEYVEGLEKLDIEEVLGQAELLALCTSS